MLPVTCVHHYYYYCYWQQLKDWCHMAEQPGFFQQQQRGLVPLTRLHLDNVFTVTACFCACYLQTNHASNQRGVKSVTAAHSRTGGGGGGVF